jgi:hypothetical protein
VAKIVLQLTNAGSGAGDTECAGFQGIPRPRDPELVRLRPTAFVLKRKVSLRGEGRPRAEGMTARGNGMRIPCGERCAFRGRGTVRVLGPGAGRSMSSSAPASRPAGSHQPCPVRFAVWPPSEREYSAN